MKEKETNEDYVLTNLCGDRIKLKKIIFLKRTL